MDGILASRTKSIRAGSGSAVSRPAAAALRQRALRAVAFCSAAGRALHEAGTPASRLEGRLETLSAALGVPGQFSANPTAILAQYELPRTRRSHAESVRVRPGGIDLSLQADLERLVDEVAAGELDLEGAIERLAILRARPSAPAWLVSVAGVSIVSAAATVFLGGGLAEMAVAALAGVMIAALELLAERRDAEERLIAPAAAFLVSIVAIGLGHAVAGFSVATAQVASLIVLVPGLEFTLAIKEIATSHLVSGSARMTSAVGDFLLLGFGLAAGTQVAERIFGAPDIADPTSLPAWAFVVALPLASLGFAARFRAHRRHVPWVMLAVMVAALGARAGVALLGPELAAFVGALAVGLAANAYARGTGNSSLVLTLPGLIILVPGSFGLEAMDMVRRHDALSAIESGFTMALIATALSTGLLLANLLLPSAGRPCGRGRS